MNLLGREVGRSHPFFLIAGPCVIESREAVLEIATALREISDRLNILLIFKSSFDKANRTAGESYRGPGLDEGLEILSDVRSSSGLPLLTDVHSVDQVPAVASVVDILQTPAFLCRQTDLIEAVAASGKPVNIKKGQFMSPHEMKSVLSKARMAGGSKIMLCERGTSFGYNNLVVDMRSLAIMASFDCPVVFDATHSVQLPGQGGDKSGGEREFVPVLARAAIAAGVSGLFMEVHPDPDKALSDGANSWPLDQLESLLIELMALDGIAVRSPEL